MNQEEVKKFRNKIKDMPHKHPFQYATLCKSYVINDEIVYVTGGGHDAYTFPTYDSEDQSFDYIMYDMDDEGEPEYFSESLVDVVEGALDSDMMEWLTDLANLFGIEKEDIEECIQLIKECE